MATPLLSMKLMVRSEVVVGLYVPSATQMASPTTAMLSACCSPQAVSQEPPHLLKMGPIGGVALARIIFPNACTREVGNGASRLASIQIERRRSLNVFMELFPPQT